MTKDKNVGYVLERLIGAMTVQQKMVQQEQHTTEELSPNGNEEEHTKGETTKNQNEVTISSSPHRQLQKEKEELSSAIQSLREDLASVEREKMELEEVQAELERLLGSGSLSVGELTAKSVRIGEVIALIDEKSMRWLELSEIAG